MQDELGQSSFGNELSLSSATRADVSCPVSRDGTKIRSNQRVLRSSGSDAIADETN